MKIFAEVVAHCFSVLTLLALLMLNVVPTEFPPDSTWDEQVMINIGLFVALVGACCNVYVVYSSGIEAEEEN
jgi:hypothetical protein